MLRTLTAVGAVLAVTATSSLARAQARELGTPGEFIISADRLIPLFAYTRSVQHTLPPLPAGDTSQSTVVQQTGISFLWGAVTSTNVATPAGQELPINFFTIPRAGFDYVILPNFTIGGDLALYFTLGSGASEKTTDTSGVTTTVSEGNGGLLTFGIAPRAGYVLRLSHLISFWLRGGLSFYTETVDSRKLNNQGAFTRDGIDQFALDLDPQFVITPVAHLGLTAGLTADVPLAGEISEKNFTGTGSSTESSAGSSIFFFGATVGLIGFF